MNRHGLPPVSKYIRRARWILLALLALAPLALLAQSQGAQKNRVGEEEQSAAEARKESGGAEEKAADDETKRRLAAARTKAPRQSGVSPEPISARAVGFAVSRPLAEVARRASKASRRKAHVEEEETEAAENEVTRVVSPQAQAPGLTRRSPRPERGRASSHRALRERIIAKDEGSRSVSTAGSGSKTTPSGRRVQRFVKRGRRQKRRRVIVSRSASSLSKLNRREEYVNRRGGTSFHEHKHRFSHRREGVALWWKSPIP